MRRGLAISVLMLLTGCYYAVGAEYRAQVTITSQLPRGNVPIDLQLDLGKVIRDAGGSVLDPNSIEVIDLKTERPIEFARSDDFAYGDAGRLEWIVTAAGSREFEVRFRDAPRRPPLKSQERTPRIGTGDLLRYNAGRPRPIELNCPARLIDLTGDGKPDLVGTWNYVYRPGEPWNGIVCYPRVGELADFQFGNLVRVRYVEARGSQEYRHFEQTYMEADFADFNGDGLVDIVYCPSNSDRLSFYFNSGDRDAGDMPVFVAAGQVPRQTRQWEHCRALDVDRDGVVDITIGNLWLRGARRSGGLPEFASIVSIPAGDVRAFFDIDGDNLLDAITVEKTTGEGLSNFAVAWRRNRGTSPPEFDPPQPLDAVNQQVFLPVDVTAVRDAERSGLLITQQHWESMCFLEHRGQTQFESRGLARSTSAVLGVGDQAWPHFCDWDGDGDLDLLIGGGYGWPRIVLNDGSNDRPAYRAAQELQSAGKPIRITRNEILGTKNWHDMGYPYPAYVDWDGDQLPDLVLANETNRIFWYKNIGQRSEPKFGPRMPLVCDGFVDSPELLARSAALADDPKTPQAPYPRERGQPFYWRTGPAFADFDGDGLVDLVTADGHTRQATLFTRYRDEQGSLRLRRKDALKLNDGRAIEQTLVQGTQGWTESYRAVDWDKDGLVDLVFSMAGRPSGGSIQLLRNAGTRDDPVFEPPRPLCAFGKPINITLHGPHPWVGDLDGDGLPDLVACVEWSVYAFYAHNALLMPERPTLTIAYQK